MKVPCCWWCYREMEIQPAQVDPRPGQPMRFGNRADCAFCAGITWAGLFVDEDTREGSYAERVPVVHRGNRLSGLSGADPMDGGEEVPEEDGDRREP